MVRYLKYILPLGNWERNNQESKCSGHERAARYVRGTDKPRLQIPFHSIPHTRVNQ